MANTRNHYEILLTNLIGKESPKWQWFMPRKHAYQELKATTGKDFGFDIVRWKSWLVANGHVPHDNSPLNAYQWNCLVEEPIERMLLNLEVEVDPADIFLYVSKDAAVAELKNITGKDFGCNARKWRQWLQDTNYPRNARGTWAQ